MTMADLAHCGNQDQPVRDKSWLDSAIVTASHDVGCDYLTIAC
jgi:hypothetical protein